MCGRLTLYASWAELHGWYSFTNQSVNLNLRPRYNFCPTERALAVVKDGDGLTARQMNWGLLQHWAKDRKLQARTINARIEGIEGISEKKTVSFTGPFKERRCLVPASGYFEWMVMPDKTKQPYYFTPKSEPVFSMARVWQTWRDPSQDGKEIDTVAIITKLPTAQIGVIHDRMPVMIERDRWDAWLDLRTQGEDAFSLLRADYPLPINIHAVSTRVSSIKNDDPEIITEVTGAALS
jgi:putative SOS response-associated peptidase YedK